MRAKLRPSPHALMLVRMARLPRVQLMLVALFAVVFAVIFAVGVAVVPVLSALAVAVLASAGLVAATWWFGPNLLANLLRAHKASSSDEPRVHNLLDSLCLTAGLEKPTVLLVDVDVPNVCVIGTARGSEAIVITRALIDLLELIEIEGALARALAYLKQGDVARDTLAALTVGFPAGITHLGTGLVKHFAGGEEHEAAIDIAAISITRYPPGLQRAIMKMAVASVSQATPWPLAWRATWFLWMIWPTVPPATVPGVDAQDALPRTAKMRIDVLAEL